MCSLKDYIADGTGNMLDRIWNRGQDKGWSEDRIRRVQRFMVDRSKGIPRVTAGQKFWAERFPPDGFR